jgi:N-acetylglucosamine transport system substrate-binding protein
VYLRFMLSKEGASKFTELSAAPTVVSGAGEGLKLTPAAASASALVKAGGDNNWNYYFFVWYAPMGPKDQTAIVELAAGRTTADEFTTAGQMAPDETATDPQTKKRTRG